MPTVFRRLRVACVLFLVVPVGVSLPLVSISARSDVLAVGRWEQLPLYGGNITSLAIDPNIPTTLYVGTYGHGVFGSTDAGEHWEAVSTGLADLHVLCLAIDPVTSAILYAGLRESGVFRWVPATEAAALPPSTPGSLAATSSLTSVALTWSASTAGTYPLAGYAVYRRTGAWTRQDAPLATVSPMMTSWHDTTCVQGATYYYAVAAFDSQNVPLYSAQSTEVIARLLSRRFAVSP